MARVVDSDVEGVGMKKLEALIDPFTLRQVKAALTSDGVVGLTISEVRSAEGARHVER
jgi:nitrogen regulatory protein PII